MTNYLNMKKKSFAIIIILIVSTVVYLTTTSIEVGLFEAAVVESPFSSQPQVKRPGTRYKFFWNQIHIYNMSQTASRHQLEVQDRDNNPIKLTLVARFSPIRENLGLLHNELGKDYQKDFVDPYIISSTKEIASNYSAEELWVSQRVEFEIALTGNITAELSKKYIDLKSLLIISIDIPTELEEAIKEKYQENEPAESKEFEETTNSENTVTT